MSGCLPNNTSGESGHWTMASSDVTNHDHDDDHDFLEEDLLDHQEEEKEQQRLQVLGVSVRGPQAYTL